MENLDWNQENLVIMGYLCCLHENNAYQRDWRAKNKDKCDKYLKYRSYSDERRAEIREYQREYYRKKAAAAKKNDDIYDHGACTNIL